MFFLTLFLTLLIPQYGRAIPCPGPTPIAPASPSNYLKVIGTGVGTITSPWIGWEDALNAMPENSLIEFQIGWYSRSKTIYVKRGWKLIGKGIGLSTIQTGPNATKVAFLANYPTNCSTAANNLVSGLSILDDGSSDVGYADIGGTFLHFNHNRIRGFKYGLILDQSEIVTVQTNIFDEQTYACAWIVNGDDFTPGNTKGYSNVIHFTNANQFNPMPTGIGIIHDGGYAFSDTFNNHNGGKHYVYIAGIQNGVIAGNEMEGAVDDGIVTEYRTYHQQQGVGANYQLAIRDNVIVNPQKYNIRNGYFGILENNLLSTYFTSILCGDGVYGAPFQVGNINSYGGQINGCTPDTAYFWLNTQAKTIQGINNSQAIPVNENTITTNLDFSVLRPGQCEEKVVPGFYNLQTTNFIQLSLPPEITLGDPTSRVTDNTTFNSWVSAPTTITIRRCNVSRTAVTNDPPSASVKIKVTP